MAIVSVNEALPSGGGNFTLEARNYTRVFDVVSDDIADGPITVINDPRIPAFYSPFAHGGDSDVQAVVTMIDPQRNTMQPLYWKVIVRYSIIRPDDGGGAPPGELTIEGTLPQFTISERYEERPRLRALQAYWEQNAEPALMTTPPATPAAWEPIRNSAGDLYQDQPYYRETIRVITVKRWFRRYADLIAADVGTEDRINLTPFWGIPAGHLLCLGLPGGVRQADSFGTYWESDMVFEWNREGWWVERGDVGFNELVNDGTTDRRRRIQDANKQFLTLPTSLDMNGGQQVASDQTTFYRKYQVYLALEFSTITPALPPIDVSFLPWP